MDSRNMAGIRGLLALNVPRLVAASERSHRSAHQMTRWTYTDALAFVLLCGLAMVIVQC
jgi:hypothetical protein